MLAWCAQAKGQGYKVILGWTHQWDETKQWLKSIAPNLKSNHSRSERLKDTLHQVVGLRFQQQASGDILVQMGSLLVKVISPDGEVQTALVPWRQPPRAVTGKTTGHVLAAL